MTRLGNVECGFRNVDCRVKNPHSPFPIPHCFRGGQSTVETALLFLAITVALVVFFSFIRSAVSARLKAGADTFGHGLLHDGK